jgi:diacylglycerol kinase
METQLFSSQKEAFQITFETLAVAVLCSFIVGSEEIQKFIILRPELILIGVALVNLAIGKYTGLRILEYFRFRNLILDQNSFANFKDAGANDAPEQEE